MGVEASRDFNTQVVIDHNSKVRWVRLLHADW